MQNALNTTPEFEIFLLYFSEGGKEIRIYDLIGENEMMDVEAYQPLNFWWSLGGLEIVLNGYNCIFRRSNFPFLFHSTKFLLHSLYWLRGERNATFDTDDEYPDDVVIRTTANELVRLSSYNDAEVVLSFTPPGKYDTRQRGDRYFEGMIFDKRKWVQAVNLALNEYFTILLRTIENEEGDICKIMSAYYDVWKSIKLDTFV